ncbi:MAG: hypothetical protein SO101_04960 [Lachnospiraceae bacterium]|nr:hypothetical protein [Lachnospiraceae bacterium]
MNRDMILLFVAIIGITAATGMVYITFQGKKRGYPVHEINFYIIGSFALIYFLFSLFVIFDSDGNAYLFEFDSSTNYYTADGDLWYLDGKGYLVNRKDPTMKYKTADVYLDNEGELIIDQEGEYGQTDWNPDVFINNDKSRAYSISVCRWNLWGRLLLPEARGVYVENLYLAPAAIFSTAELEMKNTFISEFLSFTCIIMMIPFFFVIIKLGYYIIRAFFMREKQVKNDIQYSIYRDIAITVYSYIQIIAMSETSSSFFKACLYLVLWTVFGLLAIPYLQGRAQIDFLICNSGEQDSSPKYTLKEMRMQSDKGEINSWRKRYLTLTGIYVVLWIIDSIVVAFYG